MDTTRIACATANFQQGRPAGMRPEAIVLHRTGGAAGQITARFLDPSTFTSAHYLICKDGSVIQYVEERDTAFHAGIAVNPTWKLIRQGVNPNFYTLGIELEGASSDPVPDTQYAACAALVADIATRCEIAIDADHIVLHSEIRASRSCPGDTFQRDAFVQQTMLAAAAPPLTALHTQVTILRDTNLREAQPLPSARVVSVLTAGTQAQVDGFTLRGELVQGNSAWYRTPDGNFFWAGNSSSPQPAADSGSTAPDSTASDPAASGTADAPPPPQPVTPGRTSGIAAIDALFVAAAAPPLDLKSAEAAVIGTVQDLLTAHGVANLPSLLAPAYGACGAATLTGLSAFQKDCGLESSGLLSQETLRQLISLPAKDPRASQAWLTLVLGVPWSGMDRILAITAQMEGAGKFAALNRNTDKAGLSFGLIQWAQSTGRLAEIVGAFHDADPATFLSVFGEGDSALCQDLLAHLKKPNGGVVPQVGSTTDPRFDLISAPWIDRFRAAALVTRYQQVQIVTARKAFNDSLDRLRIYDTAGLIKSERAVAFMLDVANQFGNGASQRPAAPKPDRGLAGLYRRVLEPGMTERQVIEAIASASVAAMPAAFQTSVRNRRNVFLTTPLFSDTEFVADQSQAAGADS
jgi:hypothetical protein